MPRSEAIRRPRLPGMLALATAALAAAGAAAGPPGGEPLPPVRAVPGLTDRDAHPAGCVDCHVLRPELGLDVRLGTALAAWSAGEVDARLLALSRASAPPCATISGRHPRAGDSLGDIPNACLECHSRDADEAPPFARLLHAIHLTGGADSVFMTVYQGECTHCHKLDPTSGAWSLASGPER